MRHIAQDMIPHWESFTQIPCIYAGPETQGDDKNDEFNHIPESVNDDDIIHHDDDPWETTKDENDGNHHQHN